MKLIANRPIVDGNGKMVPAGTIIDITDDNRVAKLLSQRVCGIYKPEQAQEVDIKIEAQETEEIETENNAEPQAIGGGWWILPNGEKIKGKQAAYEAMKGDIDDDTDA